MIVMSVFCDLDFKSTSKWYVQISMALIFTRNKVYFQRLTTILQPTSKTLGCIKISELFMLRVTICLCVVYMGKKCYTTRKKYSSVQYPLFLSAR
jgi:hypothetical protein